MAPPSWHPESNHDQSLFARWESTNRMSQGFSWHPFSESCFLNTWQPTTSWDPGWESLASKQETELKMQILEGAGSGEPRDSSELEKEDVGFLTSLTLEEFLCRAIDASIYHLSWLPQSPK